MKRRAESTFVLFDVTYTDGSHSSNRKVPSLLLAGLDGGTAAETTIAAQDREIALASGRPQRVIQSLARSRT